MDKKALVNNLINIWQEKEIIKLLPSEGKSMYPLIKHGDNINIKFIKPENVRIGDIVAFRRDNTTIVHRLIKKDGSGFIEKGDFQIKGRFIEKNIIFGRVELQNVLLNYIMASTGYIIHRFGYIAKPLLLIPFTINAGTRIYTKLRKD